MKTKIFFIVLALIMGVWGCQDKTIEPVIASGSKDLLSIVINDGEKDLVGNIVETDVTFDGLVRVGTTKVVVKSIRISTNATSSVNVNDSLWLGNSYITITAEDKSKENYKLVIYKDYLPSAYITIPDDNFRNAIINCINYRITLSGAPLISSHPIYYCARNYYGIISASGNQISNEALESITQFVYADIRLELPKPKIRSLRGIEQMVNLTRLDVGNNELSSLDLTNNTALRWLNVGANGLSSLDLSSNTALTELRVSNNSLSSLDVSANTALTELSVAYNSLSSLDVSANTALTCLDVSFNTQLSSLDLTNNSELRLLTIQNNPALINIQVISGQEIISGPKIRLIY